MPEAIRRIRLSKNYLHDAASWLLWYAVFGAVISWLIELFVIYLSVSYACVSGNVLWLYVLNVAALMVALGAALASYSIWQDTGAGLPSEHATRVDRTKMLAVVGLMFSTLTVMVLVGQLLAIPIIGPCIPLPRQMMMPDA